MKKINKAQRDPDMLDEYDFSNGVRGKYVKRLEKKCNNCGKFGAIQKRITRIYGRGKNAVVIENVPIISCPHCGASYLEAKTLHEIERIKLHRKSFAGPKHLDVAAFVL